MSILTIPRIKKEIAAIHADNELNRFFSIEPVNGNLFHFRGCVVGPPDTPYQDGRFNIEIKIPSTYPMTAPMARFTTKIWHPNIDSKRGFVYIDVLEEKWSSIMTLSSTLINIYLLLSAPEPAYPIELIPASQFIYKPEVYRETVQYWTYNYAMSPALKEANENKFAIMDGKVNQLVEEYNLERSDVVANLSIMEWDVGLFKFCYMLNF